MNRLKFNLFMSLIVGVLASVPLLAQEEVITIAAERGEAPEDSVFLEPEVAVEPLTTVPPPTQPSVPVTPPQAGDPAVLNLGGTELTQEDVAERERQERLRQEEAQRERERTAAEASDRFCQNYTRSALNEAQRCHCSRQDLANRQTEIFELRDFDSNKKLIELLQEQDDLKARIAILKSLYDIYEDYQGFLNDNSAINSNSTLSAPQSSQAALNVMNQLQGFIDSNAPAVERFHVVGEVMAAMGDRENLNGLGNAQAKVEFLAQRIRQVCQNPSNQSQYICQGNIADQISFTPTIAQNPQSAGELVNKFVNVTAALSRPDFLPNRNFSTLFVDDPNARSFAEQPNFARTMSSLLEKGKDHCRETILLSDSQVDNCINAPLSELSNGALTPEENQLIAQLRSVTGNSINTLGDMTNSYLTMVRRTASSHEEATGRTIDGLKGLAEAGAQISSDMQAAERALTNPETIQNLRNRFQNISLGRMANLSQTLSHPELATNQEFFSRFNPQGNGLDLGKVGNESQAQYNNRLIKEVLCQGNIQCPANISLYRADGQVNREGLMNLFKHLKENGGVDAIADMLGVGDENGLEDRLTSVKEAIARIKGRNSYKDLDAFRNHFWTQVAESCIEDNQRARVISSPHCEYVEGVDVGINDFLTLGGEIIAYNESGRLEGSAQNTALAASCRRMAESNPNYQLEYVSTGICPEALAEDGTRRRLERERNSRSARENRRSTNPNIIYEYDEEGRVIDRFEPASNFSIALPQIAYGLNAQLPFYLVTLPTYNRNREIMTQMGIQQKTQQAYYEAQRQSYLNMMQCGQFGCYWNSTVLEGASPTFGNSGFNFATGATTSAYATSMGL